jgi:hypothetical protein
MFQFYLRNFTCTKDDKDTIIKIETRLKILMYGTETHNLSFLSIKIQLRGHCKLLNRKSHLVDSFPSDLEMTEHKYLAKGTI